MEKQEEKKLQEKEEILNPQEIENIEGGANIEVPETQNPENPGDSEGIIDINIICL